MAKKSNSIQNIALDFIEKRDNQTFSTLIDRLKPGLSSYVYKFIQDRDLGNEVISQTFIAIWEKIEQYDSRFNFSTWVYAIARNESLGQLRIQNKHVSHDKLSENHSKVLKEYSPIVNMETEVVGPAGDELIQKLYEISINNIYNLKEPYKSVMIEREINKKQLQTIADDLGWKTATVKTRLRKARMDLAESLEKSYPELVDAYKIKDEY